MTAHARFADVSIDPAVLGACDGAEATVTGLQNRNLLWSPTKNKRAGQAARSFCSDRTMNFYCKGVLAFVQVDAPAFGVIRKMLAGRCAKPNQARKSDPGDQ
jgi:hypothetical protein